MSDNKDIPYAPDALLSLEQVQELDEKYILKTYDRMPVTFNYGSGEFLYDSEGKEYIDFLSGIAVNNLGHCQADLIETLNSQADLLWHTSNIYYNKQQALLARALVEINFAGKVFFCNSGTEANEAAIKLARSFGQKTSPDKYKILSLKSGFHGRSFGSMSITGQEKIHDGFGPIVPGMVYVEPNNLEELKDAFDKDVCAIIIEPIIGEGGVLPLEEEFVALVRELCDDYSALLICDEIQTGIGRTGKYFAWQNFNFTPDVVTMAKALAGGFPIGAMLVADDYASNLGVGNHGSTFGGNHLACALGYEVLRTIESKKLLENVTNESAYLLERLNQLKEKSNGKIIAIRGMGFLIGIVLNEKIEARPLVKKALENYLVLGRAGSNVLRLAPPLITRRVTIDRVLEKLESLINEIEV